jgi:hypothetical protein
LSPNTLANPRARAPSRSEFFFPIGRSNPTERVTGWFQSVSTASSHPFHSEIEHAWMRYADFHPGVQSFSSQQDRFHFIEDGKRRRYTPDSKVVLTDGSIVYVEVKERKTAKSENFRRFFDRMVPAFHDAGFRLEVVTDETVQQETIDANVRWIHAFRSDPDEKTALQLAVHLERVGSEALGDLAKRFPDPLAAREEIYSLILRKRLAFDILRPLDDDALIYFPDTTIDPFKELARCHAI